MSILTQPTNKESKKKCYNTVNFSDTRSNNLTYSGCPKNIEKNLSSARKNICESIVWSIKNNNNLKY